MAASKDNDIRSSTQQTTDVESFLNSFKTNTSKRIIFERIDEEMFFIDRDSKRSRTVCQPKGTIPYTV